MSDSSSFLDTIRMAYLLRETHRSPYEEIHRMRIQDLVEKTTRYTFFEDEKTERIEQEIDRTDRDASMEGRVTNQEIASLRRAGSVGGTVDSVLPGLYPGGFDFSEEFSRSMDGRKGTFFENVITYSDPRQVLSSGRELRTLLQYLVAPNRSWYANKATPEYYPDDATPELEDQDSLYRAFSNVTLDFSDVSESGSQHEDRKSDGIVITERPDLISDDESGQILIFSEHRSSVTTGGQPSRGSLFDKLEALLDVLSSDESVVSIPSATELTPTIDDETARLPSGFAFNTTYTFADILDAFNIDHIYIYVGALFNVGRGIATVTDDATEGRLSEYENQINSVKDQCRRMNLAYEDVGDDTPDLDITVPAPNRSGENEIHVRFTYGDEHIDAVYNGPPTDAETEATEYTQTTMADVFEPIEVDDLWINYSVSQRERQAASILQHQVDGTLYENNTTQLARTVLNDDSAREMYAKLYQVFYSDTPTEDRLTTTLREATDTFAETYLDATSPDGWPSHENQLQAVYPDDPSRAAQYVSLHTLTYDLLVQPIFTKRKVLPEAELERLDASSELESAREGLASYVFQPVDSYARPNRAKVFQTIRNHTTYSGPPSNPDTTVTEKLRAGGSVASDLHGNILSRLEREDVIATETTSGREYYYVPCEVADYTDRYLMVGDN